MVRRLSVLALLILLFSFGHLDDRALAQQSPFMPERVYAALVNELSGDIAFEHIRWFTHYHRPMGGSEGFEAVARYVEQKAKEYGLEDVRYIKLPYEGDSWSAKIGELWLIEPEERRLAFTPEVALSLADYSRPTTFQVADLVDVGEGVNEGDYAGKTVAGKVVLASGALSPQSGSSSVMEEAVWKRGALGIVAFTTNRTPDYPDQVPWMRIPIANTDKTKQGTFAFVLSNREGTRLRTELAAHKDKPFKVRARIDSTFHHPSSQAIVEAVIRGTEIHNQDIVLTGHLQEERFSANDDASGCANVMEIARALKKLIDDGRMPRPRRDIRFWWTNEIAAEQTYFAEQPDERRQFLANINQDMVGARQSAGSRIQFVTRPPFSRASFLGDVVESVVEALVQGNTSYLAAGQARQIQQGVSNPAAQGPEQVPFSRPILSRLGTREHYDARVVPFHNNTDHQVFNTGIIGIPAVTFTNWPDDYIHSSDDDMWQIDPTQLKRNAVAVAASTIYLANAGDPQVPELSARIYSAALERLSRDAGTAMQMIVHSDASDRPAAYARALNLVRESSRRERRAIESVQVFATPGGAAERALGRIARQLPSDAAAEGRLVAFYLAATGENMPPSVAPTAHDRELSARVPVCIDSVKDYWAMTKKLTKPPKLHNLMAYETLNFVDGTNSYLDIYHAVAAEADAAGEWYYATVTLDDVVAYLEDAEKAGLIRPRAAGGKTR